MIKLHGAWLDNLPRKLMLAIAVWLAGALLCVGITLNITWRLEDRGIAINEAGSLRMQSYLMLILAQSGNEIRLKQEISSFEKKIDSLSRLKNHSFGPLPLSQHTKELDIVKQHFAPFKSRLLAAQRNTAIRHEIFAETEAFINLINNLVKSIELENTDSIRIMRAAQVLLIVMAFVSALLSLVLLNRLVIRPLYRINQGISAVSNGKWNSRVDIATRDEFHQVAEGFNLMASRLQEAYQGMEEKIRQKTADLAQSNRELSALYEMTALLHQEPSSEQSLALFLEKVMRLAAAPSGSIRLFDLQGKKMATAAHINMPEELLHNEACSDIRTCLYGNMPNTAPAFIIHPVEKENTDSLCKKLGFGKLITYPIQLREKTLGVLTLYFHEKTAADNKEQPLIHLLCSQLAVSIENHRLILREKQYAVLEERNIMAQGLHDSIAQSLSFLNLQLQMLKAALKKEQPEKIEKHLHFLDTGVQQCYDDVRELLSNFRLKLSQDSFPDMLESVAERFRAQNHTEIRLQYESTGPDLSPQQQLQLVFIVQEALSNIRKHAKADKVDIVFHNDDRSLCLSITDNGCGFDTAADKEDRGHHIGLSIMRERILQVHGNIEIQSDIARGTRVNVTIRHKR